MIPDIRDIVIIVYGIIGIIVFILWSVLAVLLMIRTRPLLNNLEKTSANLKEMVDNIRVKVIDPAAQFMAMIMGIKQIVEFFKQFFKRDEGGSNG